MSATSDYSALLIDAGEYAGSNDWVQYFDRFLRLAEMKLNRVLRVSDMEVTAPLLLTNGDATLPSELLELREVKTASGRVLKAWARQALTEKYADYAGSPAGYAIVGNTLQARPRSDETLTLTYYEKIPPLTAIDNTNWLLAKASDVYLYAVAEEVGIWKKDSELVGAAQQLRVAAMTGLKLEDERRRWGNSQVVIGGLTP